MSVKSIFRAYDVRGLYGKELTEEIMEKIGNAFARFLKQATVVLGMDGRNSSNPLKDAFSRGFLAAGKNILFVGLVPLGVGMLYAWKRNLPYAYITASHLPKEYNGVKFFYGNGIGFLEGDNYKIRDLVFDGVFVEKEGGSLKELNREEILKEYKEFLLSKTKPERRIKIAIDCGNGAAGVIAEELFKSGGFETQMIFDKVDGNFPNRSPEPQEDPLTVLKNLSKKCDMGIAYDGDGDRMVIIDDNGETVTPEQVAYFLLEELLKKEHGPIIANVETTRTLDYVAEKFKRQVYRVAVGHTFLMEAVERYRACFGVESSGHFVVPSLIPFDDSLAISYFAACVLSKRNQKLSDIVKKIPKLPFIRINFDCDDEKKFIVIERLKEKFTIEHKRINAIDGVRIDLENGWVLIRASNTSPKIRLTIEADTEEDLGKLRNEYETIVKEEIRREI
ncbi:MAG: hypothetical protein DRP13_00115 [Candidatus Aenigmatarchaeota archaeon]|nr:MAG: hypothetical protein DRP13_00115 [Candidatus Aenigmarchaeota archaeon]